MRRRLRFRAYFVHVHADWIDAGLYRTLEHNKPTIPERSAAGLSQHVVPKRSAVVFRLETEHIEATHRADQFRVRRVGHEYRGCRERRVQEQPDTVAQSDVTQRLGEAEQMVV